MATRTTTTKMPTGKAGKPERLEARLTREQKALFAQAARILGGSITDFVVASATEKARRVVFEAEVLELSFAGSLAFAHAILGDAEPNPKLRDAAVWYGQHPAARQ